MENQRKKQIKALEEDVKQLFKSRIVKESLTNLKQKYSFEEIANKRIDEIQK